MDDDLKFKHPFSCIVRGTTISGKSSFCIRIIQEIQTLCTEREIGGRIMWSDGEKTSVLARQQLPSNLNYNEGVPDKIGCGGAKRCLVILDDLLNDI